MTSLPFWRRRSGFTLIEMLIVLSIIATLSIVAYASTQAIQTSRYNAKRIADVAALTNAIEAQYLQTKTVPDPTANRQYYDNHGSYTHSASGAYGVSSLFSEDILGRSALAYHPRDPDTDAYYAYGKLLRQAPEYQVGAVLRVDGTPTAYIRWTYSRTELDSLIRGYNTTVFATDGGTSSLPYNPYKKEVTAFVVESSGAVAISPAKVLTAPMTAWDTLTVETGGLAILKISDGTELIVGSASSESQFRFSSLELKDDSGLLTKVRGILAMGEVVAKAPKLRTIDSDRSDLEIETGNAVAAVRGTIFAVQAATASDPSVTFTLVSGDIQMGPVQNGSTVALTGSGVTNDIVSVSEWLAPVVIEVTTSGTVENAVSRTVTDPTDANISSITDRVKNSSAIESMLVTPNQISFDTPSGTSGGTSPNGTVVMANIAGTDHIRINDGTPYPVYPTGTTTSVHFPTSPNGEYEFEYCRTWGGTLTCSKPYAITIPNPRWGIVPIGGLDPDTGKKVVMTSTGGNVDDTGEPSATGPVPSVYCSGLWGTEEVGSESFQMVGCADYTLGSYVLSIATGAEIAGINSYAGSDISYNDDGVKLTREPSKYSYLNYWGSGVHLEDDFELELGIMGSDLRRSGSDIYTLIDSGTGSDYSKLRVSLQNWMIKIYSFNMFNKLNGDTIPPQNIVNYTDLDNINSDEKYHLKIQIQSGNTLKLFLKSSIESDYIEKLSGVLNSSIPLSHIYIGSSKQNTLYPLTSWRVQWSSPIQFFRIWKPLIPDV